MTLPAAPSQVTTEMDGVTGVRVRWRDMSTNDDGFRVRWERLEGSQWIGVETRDVGPEPASTLFNAGFGTHRFQVAAVNDRGASAFSVYSQPRTVTPPAPPPPPPPPPSGGDPPPAQGPAAPTGVTATDTGNRSASVQWQDNSSDEARFEVERSPAWPGGVQSVGANVTMLLDPSGVGSFAYRVRASSDARSSAWSGWVTVNVSEVAPAAPSGLTAVDALNERDVAVQWVDNSDNETGFLVERQRWDGSAWGTTTTTTVWSGVTELTDQPGPGTLRYRVQATNIAGDSAWTAWVQLAVDDGWTNFAPSPDSRIIYVSSSTGNDANDGLSTATPKRTINAGRALLRTGYPDWILFKRGDTFSENGWEVGGYGGRSASEPQVWGAYGDGARPVFTPVPGSGGAGFQFNWSPSHVAVVGLHMVGEPAGGGSGLQIYTSSHPIQNFLIEDCVIEGFKDNLNIQGSSSNRVRNVVIRRCVVVDAYPVGTAHSQGAYINYIDGLLIEECLFDHNGWKNADRSDATIFNHNLYISSGNLNVTVRRNVIARASSHGLQLRCGGVIEGNLFLQNPLGAQLGGGDPNPDSHTNGIVGEITGNVIMEGLDINPSNPRGTGILCLNVGTGGTVVRDNIVANTNVTNDVNAYGLSVIVNDTAYGQGVGFNSTNVSGNIFYNWRGGVILSGASSSPPWPSTFNTVAGNVFENNDVQVPLASGSGRPAMTVLFASQPGHYQFRGNTYWSNLPSTQCLRYNNQPMTFAAWAAATGDTDSALRQKTYANPTVSIGGYNAAQGGAATTEAFLGQARLQGRANWRREYKAAGAIEYIRAGFTATSN
jgi:hypothetical protein